MRGWQDFLGTKKLIIRNKIKGLGQGFRNKKKDCSGNRNKIKGLGQGFKNNKKIVQE